MDIVTTGRITNRRAARVHLAIDGRIADSNRPISYKNQPGKVDTSNLCRRCWTPARIAAAQRALTTATGPAAEAARQMLARVVEATESPTQRSEMDVLAARIGADLEAKLTREVAEQAARDQRAAALRDIIAARPARPLSGLGQLAAAHHNAL